MPEWATMPTVKRQFGVPQSQGPRNLDTGADRIAQAGNQLGSVIGKIATQRQLEHDTATAEDAFNVFRDTARENYYEHIERKGAQAEGVAGSYNEWYRKEGGKVFSKLENETQKDVFEELSRRRLNSDMETLYKHEGTERRVRLKASTAATKVRVVQDAIASPHGDIEGLIEEGAASINRSNEGINNSEEIKELEIDIRTAAIKEMIRTDPHSAKETLGLAEWKDGLGPDYTVLVEKAAVEAAYVEAALEDDLEDQMKVVDRQTGISEEGKRKVKKRLKEDKTIETAVKKEKIEETENEWFDLYKTGKLTRSMVEDSILPPAKKKSWIGNIESQIAGLKAEKTQAEAQAARMHLAEWYAKVDLSPHDYTPDDIYNDKELMSGVGITPAQIGGLRTRLLDNQRDKADKKASAAKASILRTINASHDRGDFGELDSSDDKLRAKAEKADHIIALEEWTQGHPGEDPTDWYESYRDRKAAEQAAMELGTFLEYWMPGPDVNAHKQKIASGEMDESLARQLMQEYRDPKTGEGLDMNAVTEEDIERTLNSRAFNEFKIQKLEE